MKVRRPLAVALLPPSIVFIIHRTVRPVAVLLALLFVSADASAQAPLAPDLGRATLEDLLKIKITSASRREQSADEVAAAVFVITQDDIRRSGMRTLPELFRLVPGVQVAQIGSSNWAGTIRGFNDLFSNKLLVLVDGRSIYTRVFSGVLWDSEDLVLDNIERIEVIRGPGAAVWGANAVNGVINIVTKSAKDSQGALVRLSGGTFDRAQATARYGGSFGSANYRVYSQWTARGDTRLAGAAADDNWSVMTNGARLDWARGADEWTVDGGVRSGDGHTTWKFPLDALPNLQPRTDVESSFHTANARARWTRRMDTGSSLQAQSSVTIARRTDFVALDEDTFDADLQYHGKLGARQDVVAGGGYRFVRSATGRNFGVSFDPMSLDTAVTSLFVQDELTVTDDVHLTLGSKLEHATLAGWGLQPTARIIWAPANGHHLWASASRALRTPSMADLMVRVNVMVLPSQGPSVVVGHLGNLDYKPEALVDVEAGYRAEIGALAFIDVTTFRGHYNNLPTNEPQPPAFEMTPGPPHVFVAVRLDNLMTADTTGAEVAAHVTLLHAWRVDASYSAFRLTPHLDANSLDPVAASMDGNAPAQQWQLHSDLALGKRIEIDAGVFHTGRLTKIEVPAYTRADARLQVVLTPHLSAVVAGRNLFESTHAEFESNYVVATRIPRSVSLQLAWRY
jgi:iron complex outermembrane receptor protein